MRVQLTLGIGDLDRLEHLKLRSPWLSRKAFALDNAHVESFFHSLKTELVYRRNFRTQKEAKQAIFEWIETWYNRERRHSALGYLSPAEYEKLALAS